MPRILLIPVLALLTAGCQGTPAPTDRPLLDILSATELGYTVAWQSHVEVDEGTQLKHVVLLDDLLVTVESPTRMVTAVSLRDGSLQWRRLVGSGADKLYAPIAYGDRVLVNSGHRLYALDKASGDLEQVFQLRHAVSTSGAVVRGAIHFVSVSGRLFAQDLDSGFTRWEYQLKGAATTPPVAREGKLVAVDSRGTYAMFDAASGELVWKRRAFDGIAAPPLFTRRRVLVPSRDHALYAADANSGRDRWIYRATVPLTDTLVNLRHLVLFQVPGRGLTALDITEGEKFWSIPDATRALTALEDERLLVRAGEFLRIVDQDTGETIQEARLGPVAWIGVRENGALILASPRGRLVRLDPISER